MRFFYIYYNVIIQNNSIKINIKSSQKVVSEQLYIKNTEETVHAAECWIEYQHQCTMFVYVFINFKFFQVDNAFD